MALRLGNADSDELLTALDQLVSVDELPPSCLHADIINSLKHVMELRSEASAARKPGAIDGEKYMGAVRAACSAESISIILSEKEIENEQLNASANACHRISIRSMRSRRSDECVFYITN